jgi:hypothetical protein
MVMRLTTSSAQAPPNAITASFRISVPRSFKAQTMPLMTSIASTIQRETGEDISIVMAAKGESHTSEQFRSIFFFLFRTSFA